MNCMRIARCAAGLAVGLIAGGAWAQAPLRTAFTYQGQLKKAGVLLTGTADLEFSLWDDAGSGDPPAGGNQIGSTVSVANVAVTNGLFTLEVDFGVGAFTGQEARWLHIAVRSPHDPSDTEPFTPLSPRQPLTAPPYVPEAVYAGADALHGYLAGFLGHSTVTNCVRGDLAEECTPNLVIPIAVHDGEGHDLWVRVREGEPDEETRGIFIQKEPRPGVPTGQAYDVALNFTIGLDEYQMTVAPDHPIAALRQDSGYSGNRDIVVRLVSDDLLVLFIEWGSMDKIHTTFSELPITDAHVEPYQATNRLAQLKVTVQNVGCCNTDFLVTVTDCGASIAPVVAQRATLLPPDTHTFTFDLRTSGTFSDQNQCTVTIRSLAGSIASGPLLVGFPPPTEAAQAPPGKHAPKAQVNLPPTVRQSEGDGPHQKSVDDIETRSAEIADLKTRLDKLERQVNRLRPTQKDSE